jgi:hypothetical protein
MPELDFTQVRRVRRGRNVAKARRSLEVLALDKRVVAALGGPEAVHAILVALARALETKKKRHAA